MTQFIGLLCVLFIGLTSCMSNGRHNADGSEPINEREAVEYEKTLLRCHKTGGTRIVKIEGQLRCF